MVERQARHALVAGGTGLVGSALLERLATDIRYARVTSVVRRAVPAPGRVESRVVAFDALDRETLPPADDAYCCLGTTRAAAGSDEAFRRVDHDYVLAFARAARRAGATRFLLVSSIGADARSRLLYPRTKGEVEAAVQTLGFDAVGVLRPSLLVGHRARARRGETVAMLVGRLVAPALVGPLARYRPVDARDVAAALVHLAFTAPPGTTCLASDAIPAAARAEPPAPAWR